MSGYEYVEEERIEQVERLIQRNPDIRCLRGFANYMSDISTTSVKNYLLIVIRFLRAVGKEPEELDFDDYTEYFAKLRRSSSSTRITTHAALKRFSKYLRVTGKNESDPMQDIPRPKAYESIETREKREAGFLTKEEVDQILAKIPPGFMGRRDRAIFMIFLSTGMRCDAVSKLDVESINFKEKTIITIDKGNKIQKYKLIDSAIEAILDWLDVRGNFAEKGDRALFIRFQTGRRLTKDGIANVVRRYPTDEGKTTTPHKLRATYASRLLEASGDIYFVQQCMGHASPTTTEIYIRGRKNVDRDRAASILEQIL